MRVLLGTLAFIIFASFGVAFSTPPPPVDLTEVDITTLRPAEMWHLGVGIVRMFITTFVAVFLFRSVWIRGGYEGENKILELHEVEKLITHIIGFLCLLELQYMNMTEPLIHHTYPVERYLLFGSGFLGTGLYIIIDYIKTFSGKKNT